MLNALESTCVLDRSAPPGTPLPARRRPCLFGRRAATGSPSLCLLADRACERAACMHRSGASTCPRSADQPPDPTAFVTVALAVASMGADQAIATHLVAQQKAVIAMPPRASGYDPSSTPSLSSCQCLLTSPGIATCSRVSTSPMPATPRPCLCCYILSRFYWKL
jgi:hypothetical protein